MKMFLRIFIGATIIGNLLALNWYVLTQHNDKTNPVMTSALTPYPAVKPDKTICDEACIASFNAAIATLSGETKTVIANQNNFSEATEYFVSFGSGSGNSGTFQDVSGMQTYVNPSNYPKLKQVVFEASVTIPTQNQSATLQVFNETAGHPVWNSTVTVSSGQETQFLISQPVTLDPNNNLYQVQMQTQLQSPAIINQARFHIYTY